MGIAATDLRRAAQAMHVLAVAFLLSWCIRPPLLLGPCAVAAGWASIQLARSLGPRARPSFQVTALCALGSFASWLALLAVLSGAPDASTTGPELAGAASAYGGFAAYVVGLLRFVQQFGASGEGLARRFRRALLALVAAVVLIGLALTDARSTRDGSWQIFGNQVELGAMGTGVMLLGAIASVVSLWSFGSTHGAIRRSLAEFAEERASERMTPV